MTKPLETSVLMAWAIYTLISVEQAGRALGFSRQHSYHLVRIGQFPVPVHKIGNRYKVPTAPLIKYLGIEPDHGVDTPGLTSSGDAPVRRAIRFKKNGDPINPEKFYRIEGERVLGADLMAGTW